MQHIKHYSLGLLVVLALLLGALISAQPALAKDGQMQGTGTEGDPYLIEDADDLRKYADIINGTGTETVRNPYACAKLMKDIDLNPNYRYDQANDQWTDNDGRVVGEEKLEQWTPIGKAALVSHTFAGTFDGNGKTIYDLYINSSNDYQGLFGYLIALDDSGTVKNLTVSGSITVEGDDVGGIAGYVEGNCMIINCTNMCTVTAKEEKAKVGGVVGYNFKGTVTGCTNSGDISAIGTSSNAGGVVGNNNGPGTIENCTNTGNVDGTIAGGVLGENSLGYVISCRSTGNVTGTTVGGVVGNNPLGEVNSCYNKGTVTGTTAGGVVGVNAESSTNSAVYRCYNTGIVTGSTTAGGVVGVNAESSTAEISDCYFLKVNGLSGIGDNTSTNVTNVEPKTTEEFASGEVAWLLQNALGGNDSTATQVWGQQLSGDEKNNYPVLTSDSDKKVYQVTFKDGDSIFATDYANNNDSVTLPEYGSTAGKTFNGWYNQETDGTEYTDPITISDSDLVVYAQFTENAPAAGTGYRIDFTAETATADENYQISTNGTEFGDGPLTITPGGTLYVRYEGNTTAVAKNAIDDRPEAPALPIDTTSEGVTLSDDYYYSFTSDDYGNGNWTQGTGALVPVAPGDTIYIYLAATDKAFKSAVQTLTAPERGAAPTTPTIVYGSETLSGTTAEMEYRVGANGEWKRCTDENMSVTEWMGQTVYFRTAATNENYASASVSLTIPARPVAPSVQGVNETVAGKNDGKITGLTAEIAYELSRDNGQTWTDVAADGTEITGLAPGTYQVRVKAGTNSFASAAASVIIASGDAPTYTLTVSAPTFGNVNEGYTQPAAQALTIANSGNSDATVSSVALTGDTTAFVLNKTDGCIIAAGTTDQTTYTIQPAAGLSPGTYSATITVTYNGGATATANVQFIVEAAPVDPTPDPTPTPDPDPSGPSTGESDGWESIADEITAADDDDSITIDMNGETEVPAEIFEDVAGKDVDLVFDMGDGLSWSVNGQDIPEGTNLTDLDLGVDLGTDGIPVDVINAITGEKDSVQITLAYDGDFGFTLILTAPLGEDNAGYWANLYHYDEDTEAMNFEAAAEIGVDGSVSLPLSHASQYAIVIDDHSHAATDVSEIFTDVPANHWAQAAIQYVYDNGLMTGISDTAFAPEATTTRAMIVSMLARMENVTSAADAGFTDVATDDWYATAVNWAAANGIVNGISDDTFAPNDPITREQLAAMLMNYAQWKGQDTSARADLSGYSDAPSTWASEAVQWAVAEGLLAGVTDDELQPQGQATRAQVAAIMQRFLEA